MIRPLGVPFVSFWVQFRDDLDARIHISSNPLWVSPRFGGVPRCPANCNKIHLQNRRFFLFLSDSKLWWLAKIIERSKWICRPRTDEQESDQWNSCDSTISSEVLVRPTPLASEVIDLVTIAQYRYAHADKDKSSEKFHKKGWDSCLHPKSTSKRFIS